MQTRASGGRGGGGVASARGWRRRMGNTWGGDLGSAVGKATGVETGQGGDGLGIGADKKGSEGEVERARSTVSWRDFCGRLCASEVSARTCFSTQYGFGVGFRVCPRQPRCCPPSSPPSRERYLVRCARSLSAVPNARARAGVASRARAGGGLGQGGGGRRGAYLARVEIAGDELRLEVRERDAVDDLEGVDDVTERLGHLTAILVAHLRTVGVGGRGRGGERKGGGVSAMPRRAAAEKWRARARGWGGAWGTGTGGVCGQRVCGLRACTRARARRTQPLL